MTKKKVKIFPPLTSKQQYTNQRKSGSSRNKDRAKDMERAYAKYLSGERTPLSGALKAYKGDVIVEFQHNPGKLLIECKMSAQIRETTKTSVKQIRIYFSWFPKMHEEAKSTRARFAVLATHYLNTEYAFDLVFINEQDVKTLLINQYAVEQSQILAHLLQSAPAIDMRVTKQGKPRTGYNLLDTEIIMENYQGVRGMRAITPYGTYLVMYLRDFRDVLTQL